MGCKDEDEEEDVVQQVSDNFTVIRRDTIYLGSIDMLL